MWELTSILKQDNDGLFKKLSIIEGGVFGIASHGGRVYLGGGSKGAFELIGNELVCIKNKGDMRSVEVVGDSIGFTLNNTPSGRFVIYNPKENEWGLIGVA